ncbi:MAG: hypothetical protein D3909_16870 [Candidatus Electrothrix sp. ATG1]|nr:hypothetical protein [Candidatus Electrothrix sp. ATG1]
MEFGEAEPLDLYYSRASNWGDEYDDLVVNIDEDGELEFFDWLEGSAKFISGEAALTANPAGTFMYAVWNQEEIKRDGRVVASDAWFRRVMYLDDATTTTPPEEEEEKPPKTKPPKKVK